MQIAPLRSPHRSCWSASLLALALLVLSGIGWCDAIHLSGRVLDPAALRSPGLHFISFRSHRSIDLANKTDEKGNFEFVVRTAGQYRPEGRGARVSTHRENYSGHRCLAVIRYSINETGHAERNNLRYRQCRAKQYRFPRSGGARIRASGVTRRQSRPCRCSGFHSWPSY